MRSLLLPAGSRRRRLVRKIATKARLHKPNPYRGYYNDWMQQQKASIPFFDRVEYKRQPLISIVVPAFNTPQRYMMPLVYSITSQVYTNWELIIVDASNDKTASEMIDACRKIDSRIRVIKVDNKGISANTNEGIGAAKGEYIAFADHDDVLEEQALHEVVKAINEEPEVGLIYTDEDKISDDGETYFNPHFKPDWSPDLLRQVNYITHFVVVSKKVIAKAGLLDPSKDGAQDYDFLLRAVDTAAKIYHVPKVLYHWRAAQNSTAQDFSSKPNITQAGVTALNAHLKRNGVQGEAESIEDKPGYYRIKYAAYEEMTIIFCPFMSNAVLNVYMNIFIAKLGKINNIKVSIVAPEGTKLSVSSSIKTHFVPKDENYLRNALTVSSDHTLIINQVLVPKTSNWLEALSGILRQKDVKAASPVVVNDINVIEDAGLVWQQGSLRPLFEGIPLGGHLSYFGIVDWVRNVDAFSGGVLYAQRKDLRNFITKNVHQSVESAINGYTLSGGAGRGYNVVLPDLPFNSYSIKLPRIGMLTESKFNSSLISRFGSIELKTPEVTALYILTSLKEQLGDQSIVEEE